jgi:hypothetical protein
MAITLFICRDYHVIVVKLSSIIFSNDHNSHITIEKRTVAGRLRTWPPCCLTADVEERTLRTSAHQAQRTLTLASNLYCNTLLKTPETFKPRLKSLKSFPYQKNKQAISPKALLSLQTGYIMLYINYKPTYNWHNWAPPCGRGQTPLFKAAFYGHVSVVEQLLKSGASVEARVSFGRGLS